MLFLSTWCLLYWFDRLSYSQYLMNEKRNRVWLTQLSLPTPFHSYSIFSISIPLFTGMKLNKDSVLRDK